MRQLKDTSSVSGFAAEGGTCSNTLCGLRADRLHTAVRTSRNNGNNDEGSGGGYGRCPQSWQELYDDGRPHASCSQNAALDVLRSCIRCRAPAAYDGLCKPLQDFSHSSPTEKKEAESSCGVCWPCESFGCEKDWARPCPYGRVPDGLWIVCARSHVLGRLLAEGDSI